MANTALGLLIDSRAAATIPKKNCPAADALMTLITKITAVSLTLSIFAFVLAVC